MHTCGSRRGRGGIHPTKSSAVLATLSSESPPALVDLLWPRSLHCWVSENRGQGSPIAFDRLAASILELISETGAHRRTTADHSTTIARCGRRNAFFFYGARTLPTSLLALHLVVARCLCCSRGNAKEQRSTPPLLDALPLCMSLARSTLPQVAAQHGPDNAPRGVSQSDALSDDSMDAFVIGVDAADQTNFSSTTSPRHVRFPDSRQNDVSATSSAIASLTSQSTLETLSTRLDRSPGERDPRRGVLRESFFDHWKDDASGVDMESPEEMQKKDPLGTQIWKLYHKTKGQLPNGERLENLTWRMMSMNLRRKEAERQRYRIIACGLGESKSVS